MKKRILTMLLTTLLCVSLLCVLTMAVAAANEEVPEVRYSTDGGSTWQEDSLMNALWGSYTASNVKIELQRDITLDSAWYAQQDLGYNGNTVLLDGKGYTIKRSAGAQMLFCVRYGSNVTLSDITIDGGAIWDGNDPAARTNTGLSFSGNNAHLIYVDGGATLTLDDGVILQNSDLGAYVYGAAVVVGYSDDGNGKLIMNDGVIIRGNRAESGGAILVMHSGDEFVMNGGTITENYATSGGGAVCVNGGTFVMKGGEISGNASGNNGGGVTVNGTFTLEDGVVKNNKSAAGGGGVTALNGDVILKGGEISGNSITGTLGGGVLVNNGTLTVSGTPVVTGNTINGTSASNIYLRNKIITVSAALTDGAELGITTSVVPTEGTTVSVTAANDADYSEYFTSDSVNCAVENGTDNAVILSYRVPTYTVTAINGTGGGEYEEGETVIITANAPATGKKFAGWTTEDGVTFADAAAMETTFTMPAKAVTVTANYKDLLPGKVMVNNIDLVNGEDDHTIACGDGTAVYDPDTQTLTLTNAEITTPSTTGRAAGIYIDGFTGTVTVKLVGENEITLTDTASDNNGIWNGSSAALAITGDGSLNVLTYNDNGPFGIWNQKSSVTIEDAELEFSLADGSTSNGFLVDAKAITLDGAKLTADKYKQGLFALGALTIQNQATVDITAIENALYAEGNTTIEDSTVTTKTTDYAAICIWADLTVENSTVMAHSDWDSAIYCFGLMTICGGKVSATTDEADALNSFGGITIKDNAEVEAAGYYCGVYTNDVLYVESGKLKATGTENRAILARRLSNNAESSKPTDSADAIVLGNDVIELSGATVKTNDWTYTEVWDDGEDDYVDRWRSSSYFVDGNDTALKEVTVLVGYTVYYAPGAEGAGEADSEIKAPGTPITLESAIYTRTGYTQTGWATTDGGEKAYDLGAEYTTDASVTLYPYWTANEYTVSFDANGGSAIEPIKVTYGEKYGRLPSSSVTGLSGGDKIWYLVDENGSVTETNIQANTVLSEARDHTLFAVRRVLAPTLKITLTAPGCISDDYGYYNPENSTRILTVTVNNKNEDILSYTYQWYKGEEILDGETAATLTLAGNVADAGTYKVTVTATLKQGAAITVSEAAASNTAEKTVRIARAANTLLYDANGGENGPSSNYTGGATITVTDDVPTKVGHKLTGWNTQADGEGDTYASGASYTFANDNGNGGCKVTLYAMWEVEQYTVTLVTNGGTVNAGDITEYTYGVGVTLPTNVTRSGYTFKGWYDNAEFDGDAVTEISATDNGNKEFYAKWQKKASGTVVTEHKCTSVCEVCGGCTDAKCTKDVCDDKCLETSMAFKDVAEDAWYAESVKYVYHHGIMKGVSDTEFDVGGSTTRAMIVTTLWRLEGEPVVNYLMTFEDVKADAYYAEAVRWAASEGLVLGYSAEEFCPDTAITREQMAAIIYRYAQYKNVAPTGAWAIRLEFADVADIAEYAIESVMYCTMKNLMQGRDGGVFAPQATASRAEIAVVLHRFIVNSK